MKKLLSTAILAASVLPAFAFAVQSNTVTFKGEVSSQTCDVSINGVKETPVILLPTVAATQLATKGSTAAETNFTIDISGCNQTLTKAKAIFAGNNVTTTGNLGNTGTATKVSIQVKDGVGNSVLNFNGTDTVSGITAISTSGTASLPFSASYFAEDAGVTAGTVVASAQYAISYE
ncbi:fimbrial protein [Utexia brackfieldae]|uniref:fimbrial protein n=1 Tax=Utexia brackfieldae TaxID=3074108 RepID=UPI00370DBBD3